MHKQILSFLFALAVTVGVSASAFGQVGVGAQPNFTQLQPAPSGGGGTLTFAIDATNRAGLWSTTTMPLVCPSAACLVSGSASTQYGIGTASGNRVVAVAFGYSGALANANAVINSVVFNGTISGGSCTGGTAATKAMDSNFNGLASNGASAIWYASVSSGTTATVCFTTVGGNGWGGEGVATVFTLTDSLGAAHISVSSTNTAVPPNYPGNCAGTCTNTWTGTTVPSGGIGVGVGLTDDTTTSSWSGTASPTKQIETAEGLKQIPVATLGNFGRCDRIRDHGQRGGLGRRGIQSITS